MIIQIDNQDIYNAKEIHYVFQASYKIEANLINAIDFPPLKRSVEDFLVCNNLFYGYYCEDELVGIIEIKNTNTSLHIQSLVVRPDYFRKSIASNLLMFALQNSNYKIFTVETAVDNLPAINLYQKFLFKVVKKWNTNHGIRKVKFVLKI